MGQFWKARDSSDPEVTNKYFGTADRGHTHSSGWERRWRG